MLSSGPASNCYQISPPSAPTRRRLEPSVSSDGDKENGFSTPLDNTYENGCDGSRISVTLYNYLLYTCLRTSAAFQSLLCTTTHVHPHAQAIRLYIHQPGAQTTRDLH